MSIDDIVFQYRLHRRPIRQVVFPVYDNIRSVLIIYESDDQEQNASIKSIRDELLKEDKAVVMWGFCHKKEILTPNTPDSRIFGQRDLTLFHTPKQEILDDLNGRSYELLLDLTQHPCTPLQYIAVHARASFKTGLQMQYPSKADGIHDLLIQTEAQESPRFLFTQIIKYLKMIKVS